MKKQSAAAYVYETIPYKGAILLFYAILFTLLTLFSSCSTPTYHTKPAHTNRGACGAGASCLTFNK